MIFQELFFPEFAKDGAWSKLSRLAQKGDIRELVPEFTKLLLDPGYDKVRGSIHIYGWA